MHLLSHVTTLRNGTIRAVSATVSVVIPSRDEEVLIALSVESAVRAGALEVIVCDGGSSDRTVELAEKAGARVIPCEDLRARQLNHGAALARGDAILFLHADTLLPTGAVGAIGAAIDGGASFGGFLIEFLEADRHPTLRLAAALINLRSRLTREPWGDQAQFITRPLFERMGGYREIALMEDYLMAKAVKSVARSTILPMAVQTSGRRFLQRGIIGTAAINWWIIARFHAGVDPKTLAKWYRGR